jgi:hypothetical protein
VSKKDFFNFLEPKLLLMGGVVLIHLYMEQMEKFIEERGGSKRAKRVGNNSNLDL